MRGGGGDAQAVLAGEADNGAAQFRDVAAGFLHVFADAGADFDDGLVHFRFDVFLEEGAAFLDDFELDVGAEIQGFGIDGLVFLFDAERETGAHG